eukprot:TRINITY_DN15690_c0_g1_i1.p1 TRINITY_DN15690_c0_g1~~TRINITY_DN15690_c0_g1_i1.p1  ORF type:complete len:323 (-),score=27.59 TRINITY_DN15690_c0_g1_i1:214-1182(-)
MQYRRHETNLAAQRMSAYGDVAPPTLCNGRASTNELQGRGSSTQVHGRASANASRESANASRVSANASSNGELAKPRQQLRNEMFTAKLMKLRRKSLWVLEAKAQVTAFHQYSLTSIVLSGYAYSGLNSLHLHTKFSFAEIDVDIFNTNAMQVIEWTNVLTIVICIAATLLCAVIFKLSSIYACNAIAQSNKRGYFKFMEATGATRKLGFNLFLFAVVAMQISILLTVLRKLPSKFSLIPCTLLFGVFASSYCQNRSIMLAAQKHVFHAVQDGDESKCAAGGDTSPTGAGASAHGNIQSSPFVDIEAQSRLGFPLDGERRSL